VVFGNSVACSVLGDVVVLCHMKVVVVDDCGEVAVVPSVLFDVASKMLIISAGCINLRGESLPMDATA